MDAGTPDPHSNLPSVRASDAEREATARLLHSAYSEGRLTLAEFDERTAQAYGARFRTELSELTRDLVPLDPRHLAAHEASSYDATPVRRVTGGSGPSTTLTVMGGGERRGPWTCPARHTVFALMGGIDIDLREASLESEHTTIVAVALMGGIDILVPDDLHVEIDGVGLMGGFGEDLGTWRKDPRPVRPAPPGAPVVRVTGLALMGGVGIRRVPRIERPSGGIERY